MNIDDYEISEQDLPSSWVKVWNSFCPTDERNNTIEWKVYRSQIALCIYIKLPSESENGNENTLKEMIRDQALDLGDWSNFEGFSLPLICLVQCSQTVSGTWRKIAGDQEWLRGQLSLQIVELDSERESRLSILLEDALPEVPEVRSLSDSAISKKIYEVLNGTKSLSQEQRDFLKQMAQAFESSTATNKLDEWEKGLIKNYEQILEGEE